jgi:stage II sporulation protein D
MCQFGANGMAKRGAGYREILARYYLGTDISEESP